MTNRWKSTAYKYRRLMPYALPQWSVVLLLTVLTVVMSAIPALQPWPLKILVDYALGDGEAPTLVRRFLEAVSVNETALVLIVAAFLCSLALFALETMLDFGFNQVWAAVSRRMVHELAADLFHHLQRHSLRFHNRRSVGDLLSRLTEDTWCVQSLTQNLLLSPAQHLLTLSAIGVVAWQLDPELAVLAVIVAPVLGGSALYFGPRLKKGARLNREAKARLLSFVHQTLTVIPIIQAFSTERRNRKHFQSLAAHAVALSQRNKLLHDAYGLINGLATTVGIALVLYAGSQRVLTGALSVGSLLVFLAYMRSLQSAAQGLLKTYGRIKSGEASIDRVLEVLDAQWEVRDRPGARPLSGGVCGHVRLEGVSFGYEPGRAVLQEVTLEVHP
ncbi:MAG: ABC transporter transmembrane domain-containing protein, partial [Pseudomonadota bacterium]|nr:ABC transporter transmembrane domain-containing protein [Pseudomonadota bacterium]